MNGYYLWFDDSRGWGGFTAEEHDGSTVNASGTWRVTYRERYGDNPGSRITADFTITKSGHNITLHVEVEGQSYGTFDGKIYGDSFVVDGINDTDAFIRIDGTISGSSISGTLDGEEGDGWWWGTYSGSRR